MFKGELKKPIEPRSPGGVAEPMGQTEAIVGLNDRENHGTPHRAQYTLGLKGNNSGVERRFSRMRFRTLLCVH
jgi:hypothetical protein